jgi:Uma2 family endonuclease
MVVKVSKRLFSVEEYHRMFDLGILTERDRVELIRGEIIRMSPIGRRHAACVNRLNDLLQKKLGIRALVSIQNPVELDDISEPQPDVVLLKRKDDYYESGHPQAEDILLLIEVADTTVELDRGVKIPIYAEDGIIEVWLVNLDEQCVEVYRAPHLNGYTDVQILQRGQDLSIQSFPDIRITVEEVLG